MSFKSFIGHTVLIMLILSLGVLGTLIYQEISNHRIYNGLYMEGNYTHPEALAMAKTYDENGHWVCTNILGQNYAEAIETIKHEVGHEIFAQYCAEDNNIDKCINLTEQKDL